MRLCIMRILKRASDDIVVSHWWNKRILSKLSSAGYISSLGPAIKGKRKGKEGFLITQKGVDYLAELRTSAKEDRRFWITIIASILSGIIGFVLGKMFP